MNCDLTTRVGLLLMSAQLLAGPATKAQEHVRLMPQFGIGAITAVAFSPDGRFVLTGSVDKTARLWDETTGQQVRSFTGHTDGVSSVAFSSDGRFVLTGSGDKTARLWDAGTAQLIRTFAGHDDGVTSVAISSDGRLVLTGSYDLTARLWDTATGLRIRTFLGHDDFVNSVAFSPDGRYVLTGSDDKTARLWNMATGQQIRSFTGHTDGVTAVAFSPDGRLVLTGSGNLLGKGDDKTARLWDAGTGQQIRAFAGHNAQINSVSFSPDGRFVLTGSCDKTASLWDTATGQHLRSFSGHTGRVNSVAFSPDGRNVLTGGGDLSGLGSDLTARLWDATNGKQLRVFTGHTDWINSVVFSPDGRFLITGTGDKTARLWDTATGQQLRSFKGHTDFVGLVAFSSDGHSVLTASGDLTARLWDAATGQQLRSSGALSVNTIYATAFSPDGRLVLTGSNDNIARLWDASTGQLVRLFEGHTDWIDAAAFSPDGRFVLTGSVDKTARLRDAATGQQVRAFAGHSDRIGSVAFSPDLRYVLTGSDDKTARLWDTATGMQIRSFTGHTDGVTAVAFSRDGRYVLTGSLDKTARLWDMATGQQVHTFEGNADRIISVAFSTDDRFVLTGSADSTTRVFDAATGRQLATLLSFDHDGWAVTDAEGRYDSNDPDNTPGLVWVTGSDRVIELKQLKANYYTPNLLASIMKGERLPEVKGLDFVPAPPEVAIASPYQPANKLLSLRIEDQGGGVGRLVVSVNDRKVTELEHPLIKKSDKTLIKVDLAAATLKPGENTVTAYAFDAGNQIRSHEAIATFIVAAKSKGVSVETDDAMGADYKPQFYGIVVGTASFPGNHGMDLQYPAHDAESMMTGLEIGAGKLFGSENVHLRLLTSNAKEESEQPTKKNIAAAFADVMKRAKQTDVWLVYLSGHGVNLRTEKDSYYYLTTDARSLEIGNNQALRELSTVSSAELKQWLGAKGMPLKEVLILDTCAAGAANEELLKLVDKRDVPPDQRRAIEFLKEEAGTIILMGSAADKVSYEASKYGQGLLTYALLQGMRGRSIEEGSRLNVSHWFENASEDVPHLAQSIGGIQKPVIAAPNGTGFPVALLDPADQARIPIAAIKPELLHLTCHDEDDNDPLGLAADVREQLREISQPSVRGQHTEPPVVYHDDIIDGPADSRSPKIVYSMSGSMVVLRLRIERAGKTLKEERLNLSSVDKNAMANSIAATLVPVLRLVHVSYMPSPLPRQD
jgi:WD40 repeat protein